MYHSALFFTLGILAGMTAWTHGSEGSWTTCWLALDLVCLGVAYARNDASVFGKRVDGTLSPGRVLLFLPWLLFTWSVWRLSLLLPEPKTHQINDKLTIGRRLLGKEHPHGVTTILDMTSEFGEPAPIRKGSRYISLPALDARAPPPHALVAAIQGLPADEHVFIHCAQGHGRTGLAAVALLLHRNVVREIDEGLALLRNIRPGIRLSSAQRICLESCLPYLRHHLPVLP